MTVLKIILLAFLVICALATCLHKNFLSSVLIFMSFSVVMAIIWILLESPDLAITEAAVGAGVTSLLFFVTLKKIHAMDLKKNDDEDLEENENDKKKTDL